MNIAIFTNNYLPNPYGVTTSIESFRVQFEKMGHKVFIFAPENNGYEDENSNVFRFPSLKIKYKINFPLPIPYSKEVDKKLEELDIDIIHSQHPNLLGDAAMRWAKKKNIPLVFTWHTLYNKYTHYVPLVPEKISSKWAIDNAVQYANKADKIIIPTASVKSIIENWGVTNREIVDVPTGVEEKHFRNADGEKIRKKLGIKSNTKVIMSISRFSEEKNVLFLLRSVSEVLRKEPDTVFIFGGEGHLKKEMQDIVEKEEVVKQVIFTGIVKKSEIKDYLKSTDVFVYASESETQGTIITEAMYSELPIVAVDAVGVKSLIENQKDGILAPCDENDFARSVYELIIDEDKACKLARNAKISADAKYTSEVCANRMLGVYRDTIDKFKKENK